MPLLEPVLSDRAARAFYSRGIAGLPKLLNPASALAGSRNSLLGRYLAAQRGVAAEWAFEEAARETCSRHRPQQCTTLLARWSHNHPGSPRIVSALVRLARDSGPGPSPVKIPCNSCFSATLNAPPVNASPLFSRIRPSLSLPAT